MGIYEFGKGSKEAKRDFLAKSYTNLDIQKGGAGSGRHLVGDNVVDKDGMKGKVTHADDKEVAVEHENGDVSGYEHHQVKKVEKSEDDDLQKAFKTLGINL